MTLTSFEDRPYIFLDPDGTAGVGLLVVVIAPTGVVYVHQCSGLRTEEREVEGFAVPLGDAAAARPLLAFFHGRFHGNPPDMAHSISPGSDEGWDDEALDDLAALVETIPFWRTYPAAAGKDDDRRVLQLDRTRLGELTEAWVPVMTAYGPGILVFDNSD